MASLVDYKFKNTIPTFVEHELDRGVLMQALGGCTTKAKVLAFTTLPLKDKVWHRLSVQLLGL